MSLQSPRLATYRRLLSYLRPLALPFGCGLFGAALFALCQNLFMQVLQVFLDGTFIHSDARMLAKVPLAILVLFAGRGLGDFIQTYYMNLAGRGVVAKLRGQLFERFMQLPVAYYDRAASATLLSRLTFNTEQVAQASTDSLVTLVRESLVIVGSFYYMFSLSPPLTCVALILAPVIAVLIRRVNRHFRRYGQRIQTSMSDLLHVAKEATEAPRIIRCCNSQAHQIARFAVVNELNRRAAMRAALTKALANPIVQMMAGISLALVLRIAIREALAGELTPTEFITFIGALANMTQPLRNLVNIATPIQQGIAAADSLFEIIDEPGEPNAGALTVPRAVGRIEYRNVRFSYSEELGDAVQGVSFTAQPGETIAIVGQSGSGKSTLLNLLPRLYRATSGTVLLDGTDVEAYELHGLREHIAVVSQDIVLFDDTLKNNITCGGHYSDEAIERAAATARVLDFATELPEGLETLIGERGSRLSGGQRQRIAIARALLKNAPILILDEATGALDADTERSVQAGVEALRQQRTTFVIAHRLATVERANRILLMHAGRIVESGTHAELLARNGRYASLHRQQWAETSDTTVQRDG